VKLYLHSPNTPLWRGAHLGGARGQLYLLPLPRIDDVSMKQNGDVWCFTFMLATKKT
jgi:hypothetical protein